MALCPRPGSQLFANWVRGVSTELDHRVGSTGSVSVYLERLTPSKGIANPVPGDEVRLEL